MYVRTYICVDMMYLLYTYRPIIAPMLTANRENSYYANFWCGVNEDVSPLLINYLIIRETTQHCAIS